jgi:hypothetical protein
MRDSDTRRKIYDQIIVEFANLEEIVKIREYRSDKWRDSFEQTKGACGGHMLAKSRLDNKRFLLDGRQTWDQV